jgi:hypothetical protein
MTKNGHPQVEADDSIRTASTVLKLLCWRRRRFPEVDFQKSTPFELHSDVWVGLFPAYSGMSDNLLVPRDNYRSQIVSRAPTHRELDVCFSMEPDRNWAYSEHRMFAGSDHAEWECS